jgi:hypothetical protein
VFPPKAEALFRPQAAINENCRRVPEQERVFGSGWLFAAHGGADAFQRAPIGFLNVVPDGGCRFARSAWPILNTLN